MMSISLRKYRIDQSYTIFWAHEATLDILATLCHQRKATFTFFRPISADIRVCKVPMTDGLNMLGIYQLTELPGPYDLSYSTSIGRIPQH
jgi:hypothetical protein